MTYAIPQYPKENSSHTEGMKETVIARAVREHFFCNEK